MDAFRRGTDAINRGELDIPELVHPEVVFEPLRSGTEGAFVGHEGMRRFIADTEEMFELFHASYPDIRDLGDSVLAIGSIRMRSRVSGVEADVPTAVDRGVPRRPALALQGLRGRALGAARRRRAAGGRLARRLRALARRLGPAAPRARAGAGRAARSTRSAGAAAATGGAWRSMPC